MLRHIRKVQLPFLGGVKVVLPCKRGEVGEERIVPFPDPLTVRTAYDNRIPLLFPTKQGVAMVIITERPIQITVDGSLFFRFVGRLTEPSIRKLGLETDISYVEGWINSNVGTRLEVFVFEDE